MNTESVQGTGDPNLRVLILIEHVEKLERAHSKSKV